LCLEDKMSHTCFPDSEKFKQQYIKYKPLESVGGGLIDILSDEVAGKCFTTTLESIAEYSYNEYVCGGGANFRVNSGRFWNTETQDIVSTLKKISFTKDLPSKSGSVVNTK